MNQKIIVHMIGSAHIDPVWLWRWPAGVVEVLSTCRTAANLIDKYEKFIFCRSDVWVYEKIEKHDPELFERILNFVKKGKWQVPGGWYIQPDCNLPLAASFRKHIEFGEKYFQDKFGQKVNVGYNVDSFGHSASIPVLLQEAKYDSYVMMRPMKHEMSLPSNLFRWQGENESELITWRIPHSYNASDPEHLKKNISTALEESNTDVPHVMCFYGVGDHGGGPTEQLIEWINDHADDSKDYRLEFSHPRRFFDEVIPFRNKIPVYKGELQMHAVGCYSVVSEIKQGIRKAEHSIQRAERAIENLNYGNDSEKKREKELLDQAWKKVLFNQFHDTAGGTSIYEACEDAKDQLSASISSADAITNAKCFDHLVRLPKDKLQRIVVFRFGQYDYEGLFIHEPWIHPNGFHSTFNGVLLGESGNEIDYQIVNQSALLGPPRALIWEGSMSASKELIIRLIPKRNSKIFKSDIKIKNFQVSNSFYSIQPGNDTILLKTDTLIKGKHFLSHNHIKLNLYKDRSDTWSHGIKSYRDKLKGSFKITKHTIEESGPIRATIRIEAKFRNSSLVTRCSIYRKRPWIDVNLQIIFVEKFTIAKLIVPVFKTSTRIDGIAEGYIERHQNGNECSFINWTFIKNINSKNSEGMGIVSPDCFALDGQNGILRFTLLRSPVYAWHDPKKVDDEVSFRNTDQGFHQFRFRIIQNIKLEELNYHADWINNPPYGMDWTNGVIKI